MDKIVKDVSLAKGLLHNPKNNFNGEKKKHDGYVFFVGKCDHSVDIKRGANKR